MKIPTKTRTQATIFLSIFLEIEWAIRAPMVAPIMSEIARVTPTIMFTDPYMRFPAVAKEAIGN